MDIYADGMSFAIGGTGGFGYKWNKDKSLSLTAGSRVYPVMVTTQCGMFVELINKAGEVIQDGGDGDWFNIILGKERPYRRGCY